MNTVAKHSIAIANVYLGSLPNYFHLWLRSCQLNPTITWFLFVEKGKVSGGSLPPNVRYIEFSKDKLEALVRQKVGLFPKQWRNYKICDFRPAFGHLFEEYFAGFDFWGYCDTDVIFGNISLFLTCDILANHDRIFGAGHLSLIRNTERMRLLYREGAGDIDFRRAFSTGIALAFDEWKGFYKICVKAGIRQYLDDRIIADIDSEAFRLRLVGKGENHSNQKFVWERGRLLRVYCAAGNVYEDEYIYIHLQKRRFFQIDTAIGDAFLINSGSLVSYQDRSAVFDDGDIRVLVPFWYALFKRRLKNAIRIVFEKFATS